MNKQQPFADLLSGLQQSKLSLVDVIQSLNARGPVQAPLHRADKIIIQTGKAGEALESVPGNVAHRGIRVFEQQREVRSLPEAARGFEGWGPSGAPGREGPLPRVAFLQPEDSG